MKTIDLRDYTYRDKHGEFMNTIITLVKNSNSYEYPYLKMFLYKDLENMDKEVEERKKLDLDEDK